MKFSRKPMPASIANKVFSNGMAVDYQHQLDRIRECENLQYDLTTGRHKGPRVVAAGTFYDTFPGAVTLQASTTFNVASVARTASAGVYLITFTNAIVNNAIILTGTDGLATPHRTTGFVYGTTTARQCFWASATGVAGWPPNNVRHCFIVLAPESMTQNFYAWNDLNKPAQSYVTATYANQLRENMLYIERVFSRQHTYSTGAHTNPGMFAACSFRVPQSTVSFSDVEFIEGSCINVCGGVWVVGSTAARIYLWTPPSAVFMPTIIRIGSNDSSSPASARLIGVGVGATTTTGLVTVSITSMAGVLTAPADTDIITMMLFQA